jgi:hypothetical protein|tara:strand:- start:1167 stop:1424 length:258 start_codon:yes stop_codon:yes gene_type:complete
MYNSYINKSKETTMSEKIMKFTILGWFVIIAGTAFAAKVSLNMLMIPDVKVSYTTDQCIGVTNYAEGDAYTCSNLPPKFNHIWVK